MAVMRHGYGDRPSHIVAAPGSSRCRARRTHHQPHGSMTSPAPTMRTNAMSSGVNVLCAMARAMMMKLDQMATVITAQRMPMVCFDSCIVAIIDCRG